MVIFKILANNVYVNNFKGHYEKIRWISELQEIMGGVFIWIWHNSK